MSDEEKPKVPRTFYSKGYVREVEPNTFALFRDILVGEGEIKEKLGKPVGPLALLREAKKGERVDFLSSRPDGSPLQLHRFYPPDEDVLPPEYQPK